MSDLTFSSILIENRKIVKNNDSNIANEKSKTESGIDFKNDTVLVSAKNEVDYAKGVENTKELNKSFAQMEVDHLDRNYANILNQYQNAITLNTMARAATESLATNQKSILEQLTQSNTDVANAEAAKNDAQANLNQANEKVSYLLSTKNKLVNTHDSKIASLGHAISSIQSNISNKSAQKTSANSALDSAKSKKSSAQSTILSLKEQLSSLKGDDAEVVAQRAELEQKIAAQENIIAQQDATITYQENLIASLEQDIAGLNRNLSEKEAALSQEQASKAATINEYNASISSAEIDAAQAKANLEARSQELADAVYTQTGLTLQAASISKMIKEAQAYEISTRIMLESIQKEMAALEAKRTEAKEKLDKEDKELQTAKETTQTKEDLYKQTEITTKAKYTKKDEEKEQNVFLA